MNSLVAKKLRGGLRVVRVKSRVYKDRRISAHAEYAVVDGERTLLYLIFNCNAWIAVQRTTPSSFGNPVSPINLKRWRDVKQWALERCR